MSSTVGRYLASRLSDLKLKHYFALPGDYNLVLLDELLTNDKLQAIYCCNELNAGYAADGYARANGLAALFVTHTVGGLSAINAIAGAYAEDLPVIVVSGGPNSNSEAENQILHHTLGNTDYNYMREVYARVTAHAEIIRHVGDAPLQIDRCIEIACQSKKPVYLEVACNIANQKISDANPLSLNAAYNGDKESARAAAKHAAKMLNAAIKPVLVGGGKLRAWNGIEAFHDLAKQSQYAVAMMPDAKGMIDETQKHFIGTYWGSVSSTGCGEIVESSDAYLFAGPRFTDYSTVGYTALIDEKRMIHVGHNFVRLQGQNYSKVCIADFFAELAKLLKPNMAAYEAYQRIEGDVPPPDAGDKHQPLSRRRLFACIQNMLDEKTTVIAETGDSWFNALGLKFPKGCKLEIQMQFGSIGWSVGAALGYAANRAQKRKVITLVGDGSFQLTAQEVSTMIRYDIPMIIFLMNNAGYVIEVEIHDGPYNVIKNWNYADLVKVFNAQDGNAKGYKVSTEAELEKAIKEAGKHPGVNFIEVILDHEDCHKNLLKWGGVVAHNNARPPADAMLK